MAFLYDKENQCFSIELNDIMFSVIYPHMG